MKQSELLNLPVNKQLDQLLFGTKKGLLLDTDYVQPGDKWKIEPSLEVIEGALRLKVTCTAGENLEAPSVVSTVVTELAQWERYSYIVAMLICVKIGFMLHTNDTCINNEQLVNIGEQKFILVELDEETSPGVTVLCLPNGSARGCSARHLKQILQQFSLSEMATYWVDGNQIKYSLTQGNNAVIRVTEKAELELQIQANKSNLTQLECASGLCLTHISGDRYLVNTREELQLDGTYTLGILTLETVISFLRKLGEEFSSLHYGFDLSATLLSRQEYICSFSRIAGASSFTLSMYVHDERLIFELKWSTESGHKLEILGVGQEYSVRVGLGRSKYFYPAIINIFDELTEEQRNSDLLAFTSYLEGKGVKDSSDTQAAIYQLLRNNQSGKGYRSLLEAAIATWKTNSYVDLDILEGWIPPSSLEAKRNQLDKSSLFGS